MAVSAGRGKLWEDEEGSDRVEGQGLSKAAETMATARVLREAVGRLQDLAERGGGTSETRAAVADLGIALEAVMGIGHLMPRLLADKAALEYQMMLAQGRGDWTKLDKAVKEIESALVEVAKVQLWFGTVEEMARDWPKKRRPAGGYTTRP